ncbi:MAG: RNA polymerase sigma factor [Candidatus Peribacteraceae bacterium]|nr:RNA polymerase sigma factor [Candidatus Peribacteraceae bacterium]
MAVTYAPSTEPTEAEVDTAEVAQERAQKEAALLALFTERRYVLVAICRQLGARDDRIDDLLQDAWMHAHAKLGQLRELGALTGWVRTILFSKIRNTATRQREHTHDDPLAGDSEIGFWGLVRPEEDPLEILIAEERVEIARAGIAVLSDLDRRSLDAFYLRALTLKEMAAEEGRPIGTMKRRVHDGRKRLRVVIPDDLFEEA